MRSVDWVVGVDRQGFENVALDMERVRGEIIGASEIVFNSIIDGFHLSDGARYGLADRFEDLRVVFRETAELGAGDMQLPVGNLALPNVVRLNDDVEHSKERVLPTTIILTNASLGEEITNLHSAAKDFSEEVEKDGVSTRIEDELAEYADNHDSIADDAIKLAIARKILKYGVLPSDILKPEQLRKVGFDTWFDEVISDQVGFVDLSQARKKKIIETSRSKYQSGRIAARNIRKTMWPKIFQNVLPFEPESSTLLFMYYINKVVNNSANTLVFSDELTVRIPDEEVTQTLEEIYAPGSFQLRSV